MELFRFITIVICLVCQLSVWGQSKSLPGKVDSLKALLSHADSLSPWNDDVDNMFDSISAVNYEISTRLEEILETPAIVKYKLDSMLQHPALSIARSNDKRLWIFSWYENTGGSFHSYLNVVHYRTTINRAKVLQYLSEEEAGAGDGRYYGFSFDTIYALKAPGKNLYLCLGSAITCNTCVVQMAAVVELTKDSVNVDYPAFLSGYHEGKPQYSSVFQLEARIGSIEYFKFDTKTQTLSFQYTTDDNTPVQSDHEKVISRKLKFDGKKFVGNGYQ